jgi:hypothetical protein
MREAPAEVPAITRWYRGAGRFRERLSHSEGECRQPLDKRILDRPYTAVMPIADILIHIEAEIARLKQARDILADGEVKALTRKKRILSPEGRQRIAEGQQRRWAAKRKLPS